jgi:hypothetical protein
MKKIKQLLAICYNISLDYDSDEGDEGMYTLDIHDRGHDINPIEIKGSDLEVIIDKGIAVQEILRS